MTLHCEPLPYSAQPVGYFSAFLDLPWAIWLDSAGRDRYDILVADPITTLETYGNTTRVVRDGHESITFDDPFDLLRQLLGASVETDSAFPFIGGAVGYWGYDLMQARPRDDAAKITTDAMPDMAIGIYDWAIVVDHQRQQTYWVSAGRHPATRDKWPQLLARLNRSVSSAQEFQITGPVVSNTSPAQYQNAFEQIQRYLKAGDCYQINFAHTFTAPAQGDAFAAYLVLRERSPAPFSAFLQLPRAQILSNSPERFIKVSGGEVETKPIKGTRPRGATVEQDVALLQDLQHSQKDRAENLMIVDLLRNDLGKSCQVGSVQVKKLFDVESYANVHHLVSTISGRLKPECDALNVFADCFPGGSITGAPKKRAMEIIAELEQQPRELYCGAIGYLGWDGNMDSNIAIRTLTYRQGEVRFSVGGGIVADSKLASEYQETLDKADRLLSVLEDFRKKQK